MQAIIRRVVDLKASLQDAASVFTAPNEADFARHLDLAALDLARVRPRVVQGALSLEAGQNAYPAPADFVAVAQSFWGSRERRERRPWENGWPGRLPRAGELEIGGSPYIWLDPAPEAAQITALGAAYGYSYFARHAIEALAENTTVDPAERGLLLRAQAEAVKELALRNMHKPVALRDGISGAPRNGHPAALHTQLMDAFARMGGP